VDVLHVVMFDALYDADDPAGKNLQHTEADADKQDRREHLDPEQRDVDEAEARFVVKRRIEDGPACREALQEVAEELAEQEAPHDTPGSTPVDHGADRLEGLWRDDDA